MSTQTVRITINGEVFEETVPIRMLLTDFIRDRAGLTGTHVGCTYEGVCGACTVHLDGEAVMTREQAEEWLDAMAATSICGLGQGAPFPMRNAFKHWPDLFEPLGEPAIR